MSNSEVKTTAQFTVDSLQVLVLEDRAAAGRAAAQAVSQAIRDRQQAASQARVIFAAAQPERVPGRSGRQQGDRLGA